MLCNRRGEGGMVEKTNLIKSKNGKTFKLKKNLNCKNFGIYAAKCNVMSTMWDRQLGLFPKDGALTDITERT